MSKDIKEIENNQCCRYESESKCTADKYTRCEYYWYGKCLSEYELRLDLKQQLKPFQDPYFEGVSMQGIADLAKSQIKSVKYSRGLEDDNKKLVNALGYITSLCSSHTAKDEFGIAQIVGMIKHETRQALNKVKEVSQ